VRGPGGAAECRAADVARIRASVRGVAGERTSERPPLALASFTAPPVRGEGAVRHALAWLRHRDGCVQVHLSAPDGPEVEAALAAILDSARIAQDF
jgi:tRNA threonylcarbamoyladenosine modification (KEOPS) complex  Pcc1 subunit